MTIPSALKRTLAVTVSVIAMTVAIAALPVSTPRAGASYWAQTLSEAERSAYAEPARFQSLPSVYRLALLGSMEAPEHQAALWRGVFQQFRHTHQLTARQSDTVSKAEALVTSDVFSRKRTPQQAKAIEAARLAIRDVVGPAAALYLYKFQGPVADGDGLPVLERLRYAWRRQALGVALADPRWSCDCVDDSDCYYEQKCWWPDCDPRSSWWGCGPENWCTTKCAYFKPE